MPSKTPQFYTLKEASELLKVSVRSLYRYIQTKKLVATKVGYWRISKNDLDSFIKDGSNIK